ncbi:MAG: PIN domain-containing protein [Candidatus Marsarchaeota archaeon]|nr:PIN domain-containing protein [Candidatus Marsarchaeota archaeon]
MVIFDTNVLIHYLHGKTSAVKLVKTYSKLGGLAVTCINKYELMKGTTLAGDMLINELLGSFNVLYLNDVSISIAADIYKDLKSKGKLIDDADILIASMAIASNNILITFDNDFRHINSKLIKVIVE